MSYQRHVRSSDLVFPNSEGWTSVPLQDEFHCVDLSDFVPPRNPMDQFEVEEPNFPKKRMIFGRKLLISFVIIIILIGLIIPALLYFDFPNHQHSLNSEASNRTNTMVIAEKLPLIESSTVSVHQLSPDSHSGDLSLEQTVPDTEHIQNSIDVSVKHQDALKHLIRLLSKCIVNSSASGASFSSDFHKDLEWLLRQSSFSEVTGVTVSTTPDALTTHGVISSTTDASTSHAPSYASTLLPPDAASSTTKLPAITVQATTAAPASTTAGTSMAPPVVTADSRQRLIASTSSSTTSLPPSVSVETSTNDRQKALPELLTTRRTTTTTSTSTTTTTTTSPPILTETSTLVTPFIPITPHIPRITSPVPFIRFPAPRTSSKPSVPRRSLAIPPSRFRCRIYRYNRICVSILDRQCILARRKTRLLSSIFVYVYTGAERFASASEHAEFKSKCLCFTKFTA